MSMMPYQPPPPPVVSNNSYYNQPPPQHMSHGQHYQGQVVVHEEDKKPNKFGKIGSQVCFWSIGIGRAGVYVGWGASSHPRKRHGIQDSQEAPLRACVHKILSMDEHTLVQNKRIG